MSTIANFYRDVTGATAYAPMPSQNIYNATLASGTATSITIPANFEYWIVAFSYQPGTDVWVDFTGATAVVPSGGTLAAATATLNPGARTVKSIFPGGAAATISIVTDTTTADVSVEFYALPSQGK
jgi:hypothetical protein